ncbi:MAG: helix-turn-helix transcriptional regulator [Bacilli bacterium]|nr:helix-turn-helix transcriptional regulator [Bacilli bacterium]
MRLKDIREDYDLTQKDMADILKTTQSNYSRWETGTEIIPLKKLIEFCNFFDVSMDYVVGIAKVNLGCKSYRINPKVIGNRLRLLRRQKHITQSSLASLLNTSQSTISAYEAGKTTLLTIFAIEVCRKYDVSLNWLCGGTNNEVMGVTNK